MHRMATGAGVAAVAVLVLSGCAAPGGSAPSSDTPAASVAVTAIPPDLSKYPPAPSGAVDEDTGEVIDPKPSPTWDQQSRVQVVAAASAAMAAFARPDLDFDTWWAELSPLLTQQAQQDYAYVDPVNVPARSVTGTGALVEEPSAYVGFVDVPTDVGTYTLVLTRADGLSPWLTSRFTPPGVD